MLDDGPIQTRERISAELGRLAFYLADREDLRLGLVLEDALLGAVDPGDVGLAQAGA